MMAANVAPEELVWVILCNVNHRGSADDRFRPGSSFGRYRLLRPIGRGGMGTVWAARLEGPRGIARVVALKTIAPEHAGDVRYTRGFEEEARIGGAIAHPNLCDVHEAGTHGDVLFLALEWIDGESLEALIRTGGQRKGLEPAVAARIVADACAGLHALHEARDPRGLALEIVHRDVTPHNILVSLSGHAKISDYGIAKWKSDRRARTQTGVIKGKLGYLSPEQVQELPVDRRSDVFALGAVLYTACLGRLAFPASRAALPENARAIYTPPREHRKDLPGPVADVIERALSRDPGERFATAGDMRGALETWLVRSGSVALRAEVTKALVERLGAGIRARNESIRHAFATND